MKNNEDTEKMMEYQLMNQQLGQLHQQLQNLDHQLNELNNLSSDLESLNKQETANSFSSLGGGIFVETEIKESDSVLLSVGSNIAVKKPKKEAIELVKKQSVQLSKIKEQLESEMNKLNSHLMSLK